jgi:hypothetical protein
VPFPPGGAGDTIGGTAHKFSSGSFTEGRIAAKAAVKYIKDMGKDQPQVSEQEYRDLEKVIYQPLENYRVGRNEIVAGTVSPSYLLPIHGLQRFEKIMDEYVGGISTNYMTNGVLLDRGLELLAMLTEDMSHMGAEDLHQLQRAWELDHRLLASESVVHHTLGLQEHGVALHFDLVHLQRLLGQPAWLAARAQAPLPQMLQAGQHVAIEYSVAQRDAFVRAERLAGKEPVAGVDDTNLRADRAFALLEAVHANIGGTADAPRFHGQHAAITPPLTMSST